MGHALRTLPGLPATRPGTSTTGGSSRKEQESRSATAEQSHSSPSGAHPTGERTAASQIGDPAARVAGLYGPALLRVACTNYYALTLRSAAARPRRSTSSTTRSGASRYSRPDSASAARPSAAGRASRSGAGRPPPGSAPPGRRETPASRARARPAMSSSGESPDHRRLLGRHVRARRAPRERSPDAASSSRASPEPTAASTSSAWCETNASRSRPVFETSPILSPCSRSAASTGSVSSYSSKLRRVLPGASHLDSRLVGTLRVAAHPADDPLREQHPDLLVVIELRMPLDRLDRRGARLGSAAPDRARARTAVPAAA